jgi:heat shock protein HslJ
MKNLFICLMILTFSGVSQAAGMTDNETTSVEHGVEVSSNPIMNNTRTQQGLEASDWQLSRYREASGQMLSVLPDTRVTARFKVGELSGNAGCNRYFGSYTLGTDNRLSIPAPVGATMMACAPPVSEQERQYLSDLSAVVAFQLEDELLRLLDVNHKTVLEYTAVKPLALEGTPWVAAGINNGRGGVVSTATTRLATARFKDGTVSGHAGCNTYNATYEVTGNRISLGPAMTTRMHCAEPDGIMAQEQEYLAALSRAQNYELTDNGLKLRDDNGSLQVNFVAGDTAR